MIEPHELPTFSNPRTEAMIDNWPIGRQRCRCHFVVETGGKGRKGGQRVARTTENKTRTGWNKPKRTTYAQQFVIVGGDDGKTWLLSYGTTYGPSIEVWYSDVQHTAAYLTPDAGDVWAHAIQLFSQTQETQP